MRPPSLPPTPRRKAGADGKVPTAETVCDASDTGGLPVDRIAAIVQPNELQRTALDELATAWLSARDTIRAACPTQVPATATERLGLMRERIEAMIKATDAVAPALAKFVDLLDDDQKAKLDGLAKERRAALAAIQRKNPQAASACQADSDPRYDEKLQRQYEQLVQQQWPAAEIASTLKLDDTARARLDVLQDTTLRTMETLSACPSQAAADTTGPPHRREGAAGDDAAGGERRQRRARRFRGGPERRAEGGVRGDRAEARGVITRTPSRTSCP